MPALAVALFLANAVCPFDPLIWRNGIHDAARDGEIVRLQLILALRPDLVNAPDTFGKGSYPSPVHLAAGRNHIAALKLLIAHGGDVNDLSKAHSSPLHSAISSGSFEAAELLLQHGAVLDIYSAVALNKCDEVARFFQSADAFSCSKFLANLRWVYFWHETPLLRIAIDNGHVEMVRLLLSYGANPLTQPIHHSCYISDNNFKGTTIGLTPAGPPQYDLDVPLRR